MRLKCIAAININFMPCGALLEAVQPANLPCCMCNNRRQLASAGLLRMLLMLMKTKLTLQLLLPHAQAGEMMTMTMAHIMRIISQLQSQVPGIRLFTTTGVDGCRVQKRHSLRQWPASCCISSNVALSVIAAADSICSTIFASYRNNSSCMGT